MVVALRYSGSLHCAAAQLHLYGKMACLPAVLVLFIIPLLSATLRNQSLLLQKGDYPLAFFIFRCILLQ